MGRFRRGEIVLVPFPFVTRSGDSRQKLRPALILSRPEGRRFDDASLMAVTSRIPDPSSRTEVVIKTADADFAQTGLKVSSAFRAEAIMTIPEGLILRSIGRVSEDLMQRLEAAIFIALDLNPPSPKPGS